MKTNKSKKGRHGFTDRKLAAVLVTPAMLIILLVCIYPIVRTFYVSLFDLRMNDATKNDTYLDYQINMDRYCEAIYKINRSIKRADAKAESDAAKTSLEYVAGLAGSMVETFLSSDAGLRERYEEVWTLQENLKTIPDELRYYPMPPDVAERLQADNAAIRDSASEIKQMGFAESELKTIAAMCDDIDGICISPNYVGFENYVKLFQEGRLPAAFGFTLLFTVVSVLCELCIGLFLSNVMTKKLRGLGAIRVSILIPWAMPAAVCAMTWRYLLDGTYGILARLFTSVGLFSDPGLLLTTQAGALFCLILADVWKTTPYMSLLLLAGQQTIDGGILEAATVDGCNARQKYFRITLPMMKSTILVALLFRTLDAFRVFDLISVMTNGAPANTTESLTLLAYKQMFVTMQMGKGAGVAIITFLGAALICFTFVRLLGTNLLDNK